MFLVVCARAHARALSLSLFLSDVQRIELDTGAPWLAKIELHRI